MVHAEMVVRFSTLFIQVETRRLFLPVRSNNYYLCIVPGQNNSFVLSRIHNAKLLDVSRSSLRRGNPVNDNIIPIIIYIGTHASSGDACVRVRATTSRLPLPISPWFSDFLCPLLHVRHPIPR